MFHILPHINKNSLDTGHHTLALLPEECQQLCKVGSRNSC